METSSAHNGDGGLGRHLLFGGEPDPRVLQASFVALFVLDAAVRTVGTATVDVPSWQAAGMALVALATTATFLLPWRQLPGWSMAALPVLGTCAIGLCRLDADGSASAALIVVPALWLGRQFGRLGALLAGVSTLLLVGLPPVVRFGPDGAGLSRSLMLPIVAGWGALVVAIAVARARDAFEQSERQRAQLAQAMVAVDHHRRIAAAVLDTVDVGLVLLDRNGAYQTMNRRHLDFMRLAFPDGHGGHAGQLGQVYGEDGTTLLGRRHMPSWRAAQGEEFDDCRIWVGGDPLTRRALSVSARTVHDAAGEFAGAALAYKDVTDFMRALRVKDEFIASVSHELRTPLTSIVGYIDLLREEPGLGPQEVGHLDVVARNAERLGRLVSDLLHSAKLVEEPLHVVRAPADLAAIVRECVAAATPAADAAGILLETVAPEQLPAVLDAQRMGQVVDNLVSNAIKYTPAGGRVEVCLVLDGNRAELAVSDTGIGIGATDRDRLFTRFFRTRDARDQSIQGIGLGLSIAKSIVEGHGGRIEVESEPGSGSVFRVRVPVGVEQPTPLRVV
jgi:signal transduction histidine kinase